MENAPIIRFGAIRPSPEIRERFDQWFNEFYYPELIKVRGVTVIERRRIVKENPDFPLTMSVSYFPSLQAWGDYLKDPLRTTLFNDMRATWVDRYGGEVFWDGQYRLAKSFGKEPLIAQEGNQGLSFESTPFIHIAGFRLSPENLARYATWLATTGYGIWMTLFLRVPGLKRIDCLEFLGIGSAYGKARPKQDPEYPPYVSVFHFDSLKACEDFEKSIELAAFREGIKASFPDGLDYKWYVQYQLIQSWRK